MPDQLAAHNPDKDPRVALTPEGMTKEQIVQVLDTYRREAEAARSTGDNPRDAVWEDNLNIFWGRFDWSKKADWQAREVLPEAPQFIYRWAAAMKEALMGVPDWFEVKDPADTHGDLALSIKKFMKVLLSRVGRNQMGQQMDFGGVFEEQMILGALSASAATVTWKDSPRGGYVAVEATDPRGVWLDHTGRGLYRRRRIFIDKHELLEIAAAKDSRGKSLYDLEVIKDLVVNVNEKAAIEAKTSTGHGTEIVSNRKPIQLDEWLCTILNDMGDVEAQNALCVVANDQFLIRGPEKNPFWHQRDWVLFTPMLTVPTSVYGRSYMENWSGVAHTFIEMTNLLLDAVKTTSMNAFAVVPDMLEDPTELNDGVVPNKTFQLTDGVDPKMFMKAIELGRLPPESFAMWNALKQELREGALLNELALGQIPPKGDITATEITESATGGAVVVKSVAKTIETRLLNPMLDMVWKTGLQHLSPKDNEMKAALGEAVFDLFLKIKKELVQRNITFMATGISSVIERAEKLRGLLAALQVISQNEILTRLFFQENDPRLVLRTLLRLFAVDESQFRPDEREQGMQGASEALTPPPSPKEKAEIALLVAQADRQKAAAEKDRAIAAGEPAKATERTAKSIAAIQPKPNSGGKSASSPR